MATLEDLLKTNNQSLSSFLDKYGSKNQENEQDIVSDALAAPTRPEYLALLDKARKEKEPRPEGTRSLLGSSSPEEMALKELEKYDALRTAPSGAKSNVQAAKQREYEALFDKTKPSESLATSSVPFFPTPTGAPIAETPITISQAATRLPAAASTKESLPSVEKESDVSLLLKTAGAESSQYQDLLNRYKEAEERQRQAQLGVALGQAGERIGSAIAMVKPGDQSFYEQQMKLAGGITEQFKEEEAVRREAEKAEKNDPKSETSMAMRNLLKEQGIVVPDNISAAFIEKQYSQFANIIAQRRADQERAEGRRERKEEREFALKSRDQQRDDDFIFKGMEKLTADPTYKARQKIIRGKSLVDEAVKNPTSFGDVASLYTAITALDPESVVREGEIKLTREGESLGESIQRQVRRLGPNPRLLSDRLLSDIKKYVDLIDKQTAETYNLKRDALFEQAENRGIQKQRYKAMDPFLLKEERAPQATAEEKVVVEKDGKKYRLKKSQLEQAIAQGYKEVK